MTKRPNVEAGRSSMDTEGAEVQVPTLAARTDVQMTPHASCPDESCNCGGRAFTRTDVILRRTRELLDLLIADDAWAELPEEDLPRVVHRADELGYLIARAQYPRRRDP